MSLIIGALRDTKERRPARLLAALNAVALGHTGGGFITCCCAHFSGDGVVTIANAGHLAPYLKGCEVDAEASLPIGILSDAEYVESTFTLANAAKAWGQNDDITVVTVRRMA